tara:strand:+ start:150 stop:311 length:162 start_codon:yes stop_codon:yes gene_type:complete
LFFFLIGKGSGSKKYIRVIGNKNIYIGIPKGDKKKPKRTPKEKPVKTKKVVIR